MPVKDKVVVITGSTRGIGRAVAEHLARLGARVVVSSRTPASVKKACSEIGRDCPGRIAGIPADASREKDMEKLFRFALKTFKTIDVWVNNAGLSGGYRYLTDMTPETIRKIVDTNITGTLLGCRAVLPYFLKQNKGVILNFSGRGGRQEPSEYMSVYACTKAAVTSLTKSLAREYRGKPVSILALLPGMVDTDMTRSTDASPSLKNDLKVMPVLMKALGTPVERVARAVEKLAAGKPGRGSGKIISLVSPVRMMLALPRLLVAFSSMKGTRRPR